MGTDSPKTVVLAEPTSGNTKQGLQAEAKHAIHSES